MSTAEDQGRWLVVYNLSEADSLTWASWYSGVRTSIPAANYLGIALGTAEQISGAAWATMRDAIKAYIAAHPGLEIAGILIGYKCPGTVAGTPVRSVASLCADLDDDTAHAANAHAISSATADVADLPARATLIDGAPYLVAEIAAPTLADATALTTRAQALDGTTAAGDELVTDLDPSSDEVGYSASSWSDLTAWLADVASDKVRLPVASGFDGSAHGYALEFTDATSGSVSVAGQNKAALITIGTDSADVVLTASGSLVADAVDDGYALALGYTDAPTSAHYINPAPLVAALRAGWTWAEAVALASPVINSTIRAIGDPFARLPLPEAGFNVYRQDTGALIAVAPAATPYAIDLDGILEAGNWTLGLSATDRYATESAAAEIVVEVTSGAASVTFPVLVLLGITVEAAGYVAVRFRHVQTTQDATPTTFEVADASDPDTVLDTVTATGSAHYASTLGPFADGATVRPIVRPAAGADKGAWQQFDTVIADAAGPEAPVIYAAT